LNPQGLNPQGLNPQGLNPQGLNPQVLSTGVLELAGKDAELKGVEVHSQHWQERGAPAPADSKRTAR